MKAKVKKSAKLFGGFVKKVYLCGAPGETKALGGNNKMKFALNYYNGYVVCLVAYYEPWHRDRFFPLRNFGDHLGDARIFKEVDCPDLSDVQLRMLITSYKNDVIYKRINSKRCIPEHEYHRIFVDRTSI